MEVKVEKEEILPSIDPGIYPEICRSKHFGSVDAATLFLDDFGILDDYD